MKKFIIFFAEQIIRLIDFSAWFFGIELKKDEPVNELESLILLNKQIVALEEDRAGLQRTCNALIEERFGSFVVEDLDIRTLQLQYGSFFINAAFGKSFNAEELFFFKKTFMGALETAYEIGRANRERVA